MTIALVTLGLTISAVIYTAVNGELKIPFIDGAVFAFGKEQQDAAAPTPVSGSVDVYCSPRTLPAYTKITREHLLTENGSSTIPVIKQAVETSGLYRADPEGTQRLLGRVLKREKKMYYAFSEADFLPKGTRPGPSAGIPPGQRGVWVDVSKVNGLAELMAGDLIDLVAATAETKKAELNTTVLGNLTDTVMQARLEAAASKAAKGSATSSWVVARGAQVITPIRSRPRPGANAKRGSTETIDEIFLAMAPDDVAKLGQALAQKVTLLAAPRTNQPNAEPQEIADAMPADATAELRKALLGDDGTTGSFGMVEVIRGANRETVTVPRGGSAQEKR